MESPEGSPLALKAYGEVPPVADIEAVYAPPAVPLERLAVVMLRAVGLPVEEGGVRVTFPQPAIRPATKTRSRDLDLCKTIAPCVSREPKGGDSRDKLPFGCREIRAVQGHQVVQNCSYDEPAPESDGPSGLALLIRSPRQLFLQHHRCRPCCSSTRCRIRAVGDYLGDAAG